MMLAHGMWAIMRDELVHSSVSGAEICWTGLYEQHDRDRDEDHDDTELRNASLSGEHEHVDCASRGDERLVAIIEEVVNHEGYNRGRLVDFCLHGRIDRVGVQLVKPLYYDEDIHPAEQAEKDDQTSDDLCVEDYLLVEIESV